MAVFILAAVALGSLGIGWVLVRNGLNALTCGLAAALGLAAGWLFYMTEVTPGWDGLGYAIVLMLGALPALAGLAVGALIGRWRRIRAETPAKTA
ncbi:hypothetical protein [Mameliella sediminis]|uniref:hypothetical protein n=1 Tax=Mameliella sediminis TaxID=2836866 RepID=UPI001C43D306|nr:hypothetical protein [Mameliella sediminis]MBV7397050.1 hypothetical protein [Mameliella sediminis]